MKHSKILIATLGLAALTAAAAVTLTPIKVAGTEAPAPTQPAPTQPSTETTSAPSWMAGAQAELGKLLQAGGQVSLLDASGAVIGTLNADGTVKLNDGVTADKVTSVRVEPKAGSTEGAMTYQVSGDLSRWQSVRVTVTSPGGKAQTLPLAAVLNRQAKGKPDSAGKPEQPGKSQQGAPAQKGGQGKGKGKSGR